MKVGVINLSTDFEETYYKELKKNDIAVSTLNVNDFERDISKLDGILIHEDGLKDTAKTCSILLKLKENTGIYTWVVSLNPQKLMKSVYLQLGVVGVIPEDCSEEELQLIVSNSLAKKEIHQNGNGGQLDYTKRRLELVPRNHTAKINGGKEIPLTKLEYRVLDCLYKHANNTVTYAELFENIWNKKAPNQHYRIANLIFHLREKLESNSVDSVLIRTVRSKGYMLDLNNY